MSLYKGSGGYSTGKDDNVPRHRMGNVARANSKYNRQKAYPVIAAVIYQIWRERNSRIIDNKETLAVYIVEEVEDSVTTRLAGVKFN